MWVTVYGVVASVVYGHKHSYWCPIVAFAIAASLLLLTGLFIIFRRTIRCWSSVESCLVLSSPCVVSPQLLTLSPSLAPRR